MKKVLSLLFVAAIIIVQLSALGIISYAEDVNYGDVNADGNINSSDALEALMVGVGIKSADDYMMEAGDIDKNGVISSMDALMILQYSVGIEMKIQGVTVNSKDRIVKKGDTFSVSGAAYPVFADDLSVSWSSSDDKIAKIDTEGNVTVTGEGVCRITCASNANNSISSSFEVASNVKVSSLSLDRKSDSVQMGRSVYLKASVSPSNAYNKAVAWKTSDDSIASVDANGKVHAKSIGTAVITCTTADGTGKSAVYTMTVGKMNIPYVNQMYDYPTGCEAASCCMLLKYYGFSITMNEMVDIIPRENLEYINNKWYGPDINEKFVGDPRYGYRSAIRGYGAFSPCITKALQVAVDQRGGGFTAHKMTGCSYQDLLVEMSKGKPVLVWATYMMNEPTDVNAWYIRNTGKYFQYPKGTHVMVLCGYDKNNVYIMDPYNHPDVEIFSKDLFIKRWNLLGNQAIVLDRN